MLLLIAKLMLAAQALRYLLFEHKTLRPLWNRFNNIPVLGTFLNCAFCQGFWLGLIAFLPFLTLVDSLLWAFASGWISITWHNWLFKRKEKDEEFEPEAPLNQLSVPENFDNHPLSPLPEETAPSFYNDQAALLECNIDDMSGEFFGDLLGRLFTSGAVDVWFTPVYGKKNRPLYQVSVLAPLQKEESCIQTILEHSSSAGLRRRVIHRVIMDRRFIKVEIHGYPVAVKRLSWRELVKYSPEWDDCAKASEALKLPLSEIYSRAQIAAREKER